MQRRRVQERRNGGGYCKTKTDGTGKLHATHQLTTPPSPQQQLLKKLAKEKEDQMQREARQKYIAPTPVFFFNPNKIHFFLAEAISREQIEKLKNERVEREQEEKKQRELIENLKREKKARDAQEKQQASLWNRHLVWCSHMFVYSWTK